MTVWGFGTDIRDVNIVGRGEGVGGQRLGMFIFWEGWFRVGGLGSDFASGMLILG